jgi:hypothetical protein
LFVSDERQKLFDEVEKEWNEREKQVTSVSSGGSDVPEEECEGDTSDEIEECIVKVQYWSVYAVSLQHVNYHIIQRYLDLWYMNHFVTCTCKYNCTHSCIICILSKFI